MGICRDVKVEYVLAAEHDQAIAVLVKLARAIALTTPREGECLRHWRALQLEARRALEAVGQ